MLELRPFQKEALNALKEGTHLICVSATGSGKSLIYERAVQEPGTRMVLVTPLVALARQQYTKLRAAGIPASLGSGAGSKGPPEGPGAWIVSPESLAARISQLQAWSPHLLAVDECHCLWDWGQSFRPAFRKIDEVLSLPSLRRSLWLTATLPPPARRDLHELLGKMTSAQIVEQGRFDLPPSLHLSIRRIPWRERLESTLNWVLQQREPGIIFAQTRQATERISRLLRASGKESLHYHAGMSAEERRANEGRIRDGFSGPIIATSAFGMGMDYPHLKWVMLWQAPRSLLEFAQAVGRVARGTARARAIALWDEDDFKILEASSSGSELQRQEWLSTLKLFNNVDCRRRTLAEYFDGEKRGSIGCRSCDYCDSISAL